MRRGQCVAMGERQRRAPRSPAPAAAREHGRRSERVDLSWWTCHPAPFALTGDVTSVWDCMAARLAAAGSGFCSPVLQVMPTVDTYLGQADGRFFFVGGCETEGAVSHAVAAWPGGLPPCQQKRWLAPTKALDATTTTCNRPPLCATSGMHALQCMQGLAHALQRPLAPPPRPPNPPRPLTPRRQCL